MDINSTKASKILSGIIVLALLLPGIVLGSSKYDRLLGDEQGRAKLAFLATMVQNGYLSEQIRPLITDPDPLVRMRCAEVLGQIDDPIGTIFYLSRLSRDEDPGVILAAVYSLGLAGHRPETEQMTLESIENVLKSGPAAQKKAALHALGLTRLKPAAKLIVPYLRNFSSSVRTEAAIALTATGDSASAGELVPSLYDPDAKVVAAAVYAIGRLGYTRAIEKLVPLLASEDAGIRMRVAESLGRLDADKSVGFVAKLLGDPERMVAIKAAEALARIGNDNAADKLVDVLGTDDPYMKTLALQGIAASEKKKLFKKVTPLLDDESVMVRRAAIRAVSATGREKAREHLLRMYREGNHYDRMIAIEYLGVTGEAEDLALLASILDSKADHFSREGAAAGLGRWPEPEQLLNEDESGRRPVDALLAAASGDDWVVASLSIESLGKTVPTEVVDELIAIFNRSSGRLDSDIKLTVLGALAPVASKGDAGEEIKGKIIHLLKSALVEKDPRIPALAAQHAGKLGLTFSPDLALARDWDRGIAPSDEPVLPMGDRKIALVTSKGRIEIVLFGDEAPAMVQSILKLASEGFYKGLNFHRVVPGFVIQGGCPRGDGWGDAGYFLRSEFNPHRYDRGAMGVAHAGKDTPGSQFFLTHVAQPHLDGRYTVIGMIESGIEIIDFIEIGDTLDMRVID